MTAATRSPEGWDWRQMASLSEQLRNEDSFKIQRDRIISVTGRLIEGEVEVWLQENAFRLPDSTAPRIFPSKPSRDGMKQALKSGKLISRKIKGNSTSKSTPGGTYAAVPLEDHGFSLGVLQITRPKGPEFSKEELGLLQGVAQFVSVGLFASHRAEVEQFRLRQLNLVRAVSAQIANVLDIDELAQRVTELIQKTFNYYYVAIFTLEPPLNSLLFRSSASAPRKGKKRVSIALEVELGQGLIGQAAREGQQIVADDVQGDARYRFIDSLPETRSEVVIPLKIENQILGVMDVQSNQPKAFHPNDLLVLNSLADNIARAVESARLYSGMARRASQLSLVSEVSNTVRSTLDLSVIMQEAANLIHEKFKFSHVSLYTVHPNRRLIMLQAGSGKRSQSLKGYAIKMDQTHGIMPWVARNAQTVLVNDVNTDERYAPSPFPPTDTRSELCVPLVFERDVVGLLDIQSDLLNAFTEDDRLLFEAVADAIASAIRNADLFRSEQWRRQTSDSLRDVAGLISTNAGVEEVLETILTELDRNLPTDISAIWLLEDGDLCLSAVHGCDPRQLDSVCLSDQVSVFAMAEALTSNLPVIRRPQDPIWPAGLAAGYKENYSSIAAPLRVGERSLGILTLAHHTAGRYGHEAQAITTTFASYAAIAIENARLYDSAQEQAYASAALLQVAQSVVSMSDLDEILGSITRIMPILVGVHRVALYRWDSENESFAATQEFGFSEQEESIMTEREFKPGAFPLLDYTREQNRMVTWPAPPGESPQSWLVIRPEAKDESESGDADQLIMAVPLSIKNDFFGVLLVEEVEKARRFRSRRIEIISGIAQQAALAIQNDLLQQEMVVRERLETEIQLARQIQQTFIPQNLPEFASWQLAACWRTAREVGGDFYDVIELGDGKLGFFIADIADKGVPAALFMALTRTLVRAAVFETSSPAEVLRRVNEQLLPDAQQGMFVTAVYGVLDQERGDFVYANAGHNPPFWVKSEGGTEKLTRTGVALGVMEQPSMLERKILLLPGDTVLLYTDGLTEAFSPSGEMFGERRLLDILIIDEEDTANDVLARIEGILNEFTDSMPRADDLTMLAIKRK